MAALGLMGGCSQQGGEQASSQDVAQTSFFCFDTVCAVGGDLTQGQLDAVRQRCEQFERTLSRTVGASDVARINAAGGRPVEVESQTAELIELSLGYSRASQGLFDVTIGAVSRLWDFKEGVVPDPAELSEALTHVGYENVRVEGDVVTLLDPHAAIDLGGIAKGYVADVVLDELASQGVTSAFVNLGGNVKVLGAKGDGTPWVVGVRDPAPDAAEGATIARVSLEGGSVVTSGLYERRFEKDGRQYWHILDPRTGYPVQGDVVSASIVSERSIDGDGFTKPLFMMGVDEGLAFLEEHGVEGLVIRADATTAMTGGGAFELR